MLTGLFKDARFSPFSNLHTCISLVAVCCFGQCLGWRFSAIYIFSLLRVFARLEMRNTRDFGVGIKLCLLNFLKMLDLALSQIYTRVFNLWKSIDLESVWVGDSRPYQLSFLS